MKRCISLILALILFCPALFSCGGSVEIDSLSPPLSDQTDDDEASAPTDPDQTDDESSILTVPGQTPNHEYSTPTGSLRLEPYSAHGSSEPCDGGISLPVLKNSLPEEWKSGKGVYRDKTLPKSVTVTLFGKEYTHGYIESCEYSLLERPQNHRTEHTYGDLKNATGYVTIDAESQTVISWRAVGTYKDYHPYKPTYSIEADELKKTAEKYVEYLVGQEQLAKYEYVLDGYNGIYFRRMINGYQTDEYVYLKLLSDGTIAGFDLCNIGLYNDVDEPKFDSEKAKTTIDAQVDERYLKKYPHCSWSEKKIDIVVLPNGQVAYRYNIDANVCIEEEKIEEGEYAGETLCIMGGELLTYMIITE